jgi:uncharacterized membrane protein
MTKLYVVLTVALVIESFGNIYITKGMKEVGEVSLTKFSSLGGTIKRAIINRKLVAGVGLLAVFFALFLAMLSWADISVVLPLTSIGYILTALFARWMLQEDINLFRWIGILLIVPGVFFVTQGNRGALHETQPAPATKSVNG